MAVIDLSITSQRQKAVDFTMPYMNTGKFFHFIFLAFFKYDFKKLKLLIFLTSICVQAEYKGRDSGETR